ncbi:MAG: hypothetical protein H8E25_07905 [Planctomycetes bacterium]|nr:hypothetical protein [Planctomycetota bacterium]
MVLSFEDTPLFDWFKKNRVSILLMLAIVFGGNAYFYYAPGLVQKQNAESWSLYQTISSEIDLKENLSTKLAQAEADGLTYQWVVYSATRMALQADDANALEILRPRLSKLATSNSSKSWVATSGSEVLPIADILLAAIENSGSDKFDFDNQQPDGDSYVITVTDGAETTYDVVLGLFSAAANTVEHFTSNLDGIVGQDISNFSNVSLTVENGLEENDPAIAIERVRLFHSEGVLTTVATKDRDGSQKANTVQIMLQDNFFADGQSTVFGMITSGLDELKEAVAALPEGQSLTVTAVTKI